MSDDNHGTSTRDAKGRFLPGKSPNPAGRPVGSVRVEKAPNLRDIILRAADLQGRKISPEADDGVEAYLVHLSETEPRSFAGLLGKILPLMPVRLALPPISKPEDLVTAASEIAKAASEGEISTSDASALSNIVGAVGKSIEVHQLEQRLAALEAKLEGQK
jgi:hypothetical protein